MKMMNTKNICPPLLWPNTKFAIRLLSYAVCFWMDSIAWIRGRCCISMNSVHRELDLFFVRILFCAIMNSLPSSDMKWRYFTFSRNLKCYMLCIIIKNFWEMLKGNLENLIDYVEMTSVLKPWSCTPCVKANREQLLSLCSLKTPQAQEAKTAWFQDPL